MPVHYHVCGAMLECYQIIYTVSLKKRYDPTIILTVLPVIFGTNIPALKSGLFSHLTCLVYVPYLGTLWT